MTERPILFSAPMVRAILAGTKTQTRRVLKQATGPSLSVGIDDDASGVAELSWLWGDGPGYDVLETIKRVPCPYGRPGDKLWVRETWQAFERGWDVYKGIPKSRPSNCCTLYAADDVDGDLGWRPSIHMPRWASRITLEITGVRVERLQAISEADAIAEGIEKLGNDFWSLYGQHNVDSTYSPKASYRALWMSINGHESWHSNPWVWVVEFRRVTR